MIPTVQAIASAIGHERERIIVVTGDIGAGKTTWCTELVAHGRDLGLRVAGLMSLGVFESGQKIGIELVDVMGDERRRLATRREVPQLESSTPHWEFVAETLLWGDQVLRRIDACDWLVLDELGPLELKRQEGWQHAFVLLERRAYAMACVVVRPSLLEAFTQRFEPNHIIQIGTHHAT